jgi:beta-phosphoglucomutase-like phosphatase (HAD superfamily)
VTDPTVAVLDIDGTLIDSSYQHALAWYREQGKEVDALLEEMAPLPGARDLAKALGDTPLA